MRIRQQPPYLLIAGLVLNLVGTVLSTPWTSEVNRTLYLITNIGLGVLLFVAALAGRRWAVYLLVALSLISGIAQAATLETGRLAVSALDLAAAVAFIAYASRTSPKGQGAVPRT